jgi:hypothetical protein
VPNVRCFLPLLLLAGLWLGCSASEPESPPPAAAGDDTPAGVVLAVEGEVTATRAAEGAPARALAVDAKVFADDTVKTAEGASITVRLNHNNANWTLEGGKTRRVDKGAAWRAPKGEPQPVAEGPAKRIDTTPAGRHAAVEAATTGEAALAEAAPAVEEAAPLDDAPAVAAAEPPPAAMPPPAAAPASTRAVMPAPAPRVAAAAPPPPRPRPAIQPPPAPARVAAAPPPPAQPSPGLGALGRGATARAAAAPEPTPEPAKRSVRRARRIEAPPPMPKPRPKATGGLLADRFGGAKLKREEAKAEPEPEAAEDDAAPTPKKAKTKDAPAAGDAPPARLQVAKVFGRAADEVKAVFAQLKSPAACARVTPKQRRVVVLNFGPDGRLTGTKYAGGGAPNAATKACVDAMTRGLKLPPAKKATAVTAILHAGK